ncbi:hypothetical protein Forpe1208_v016164 [Fusarium oxysporum f. sp. rapae]|uniref:Uncharacterized protein n=1 Tax=Fusarium oxysporum f. sp. rapae TaxID=485398 RepID=A0A8J5NJC2_FUSOX|nr:hypothetical protein Forpe1208_v016164 [Fusarium oxysporum f. sp. rapae]
MEKLCRQQITLFIGISFTVEVFKLFDDNDLREICTLAGEYIETYSLKDYFLQMGFYKATQKLVGKVSEWKSDITQFICDALEKYAGTSKNKDSANDDHPTSKRSRDGGHLTASSSFFPKRNAQTNYENRPPYGGRQHSSDLNLNSFHV